MIYCFQPDNITFCVCTIIAVSVAASVNSSNSSSAVQTPADAGSGSTDSQVSSSPEFQRPLLAAADFGVGPDVDNSVTKSNGEPSLYFELLKITLFEYNYIG